MCSATVSTSIEKRPASVSMRMSLGLLGAVALHRDDRGAAVTRRDPRRSERDTPLGSVDAQRAVVSQPSAARNLSQDPPGECQRRGSVLVDAGRAEHAGTLDLDGLGEGLAVRRAGQEPRHRHRVATDVENAAAGEVVVGESLLGCHVGGEGKGRLDETNVADGLVAHQLDELLGLRMAAVHEGFHQEDAGALRGLDDGHRLRVVHRERLLAEDVLARLGRADRPFGVEAVRGGDVDDLHIGIREERVVRCVTPRDRELVAELVGALFIAAAHRHQRSGLRIV